MRLSVIASVAMIFIIGLCTYLYSGRGAPCPSIGDGIRQEFEAHRPGYSVQRKRSKQELDTLRRTVFAAEQRHEEITCAGQIMAEAGWLISYTDDFERAERRMEDLKKELAKSPQTRQPDRQSATDGSWGNCFEEWFFKVTTSVDHIAKFSEEGKTPQYALRFLDRINSPEKLRIYFESLLISEVGRTGRYNRRELNEGFTSLIKYIRNNQPKNYNFHPKLRNTLFELIRKWQDPDTGYWGAWFRHSDGTLSKTSDLSITFHIVSYLKGELYNLGKLFATTLAIRSDEYPVGWLEDGNYENHHNYDVVRLFRFAWPYATGDQRALAKKEIQEMLSWCLHKSMQKDGTFKLGKSDDSLEDSFYFGISFLDEVGFFAASKRFWTAEEFPDSEQTSSILIARVESLLSQPTGKSGVFYRSALDKLIISAKEVRSLSVLLAPEMGVGFHVAAHLYLPDVEITLYDPEYVSEIRRARQELGMPDQDLEKAVKSLSARLNEKWRLHELIRIPALFESFDDTEKAFNLVFNPKTRHSADRPYRALNSGLFSLYPELKEIPAQDKPLAEEMLSHIKHELGFLRRFYAANSAEWEKSRSRFEAAWRKEIAPALQTLDPRNEIREIIILLSPALRRHGKSFRVREHVGRVAALLPRDQKDMEYSLLYAFHEMCHGVSDSLVYEAGYSRKNISYKKGDPGKRLHQLIEFAANQAMFEALRKTNPALLTKFLEGLGSLAWLADSNDFAERMSYAGNNTDNAVIQKLKKDLLENAREGSLEIYSKGYLVPQKTLNSLKILVGEIVDDTKGL